MNGEIMSFDDRVFPVGRRWVAVAILLMIAAGAGCSSTGPDPSDAWVRSYLDQPDRVWDAIHLVLDDLGYEVEKEDRVEGTIRAAAIEDQPYRGVILKIDQIARTDIVRVHVQAGGGDGGQPDLKRLESAVSEFLGTLDVTLGGWSEGRTER